MSKYIQFKLKSVIQSDSMLKRFEPDVIIMPKTNNFITFC